MQDCPAVAFTYSSNLEMVKADLLVVRAWGFESEYSVRVMGNMDLATRDMSLRV